MSLSLKVWILNVYINLCSKVIQIHSFEMAELKTLLALFALLVGLQVSSVECRFEFFKTPVQKIN